MKNSIAIEKKKSHRLDSFIDFVCYLRAKLIQILNFLFGYKKIDVAFISNIRNGDDARNFGFAWKVFRVLPWIFFQWKVGKKKIRGRLFMIGRVFPDDLGKNHSKINQELAIEAIDKAVKLGGDRICVLFAANAKRIFDNGEMGALKERYPNVTFTLGDNFTAVLIKEMILKVFKKSNLDPKKAKVMVVAPYGILGGMVLEYMKSLGCKEIVCMGTPDREEAIKKVVERANRSKKGDTTLIPITSFDNLFNIDIVIPCDSNKEYCRFSEGVIDMMRKKGRKLVFIDLCEPRSLPKKLWQKVQDRVICYDAGNGYTQKMTYFLGWLSYNVLGMAKDIFWGCFCETFLLALYPRLLNRDWFPVNKEGMDLMENFLGDGDGEIALPELTSFFKPINDYSLEYDE